MVAWVSAKTIMALVSGSGAELIAIAILVGILAYRHIFAVLTPRLPCLFNDLIAGTIEVTAIIASLHLKTFALRTDDVDPHQAEVTPDVFIVPRQFSAIDRPVERQLRNAKRLASGVRTADIVCSSPEVRIA